MKHKIVFYFFLFVESYHIFENMIFFFVFKIEKKKQIIRLKENSTTKKTDFCFLLNKFIFYCMKLTFLLLYFSYLTNKKKRKREYYALIFWALVTSARTDFLLRLAEMLGGTHKIRKRFFFFFSFFSFSFSV